jgi:hypothetical protein
MRIPEKVDHRGKCMCHGCEIECKWENQKLTVELISPKSKVRVNGYE